ncbi:Uncharacterised protein [Mycobacteroides abscessus subsp. abscessus]|nr:Uncharacterised protein [Mycobacteroides abscessus subsp. abscessus]
MTWSGSPPKAAMLSRTHVSAAIWSRSARLSSKPSPSALSSRPPNAPRRYVTLTTTTLPLAASRAPLYNSSCPAPNTNAPPGIHTITGRLACTSGDHTVTVRHSSPRILGSSRPAPTNDLPCGGNGACSMASRTPSQGSSGTGARNRSCSTGCCA